MLHLLHKPGSLETINFLSFSEHNILHELVQLFILPRTSFPDAKFFFILPDLVQMSPPREVFFGHLVLHNVKAACEHHTL